MNNLKFLSISLITATLMFSACGSSSDDSTTSSSTETGTFIDAPVKGLHYVTATQDGYTDENGNFKYQYGETVEFKLGNLSLGKGIASTLITPYTISDNNDTATNIALILQNFDGNRSNPDILDLSKLENYNFTTSDFNLSNTPTAIKGQIDILFADNDFAQYRDDINNSVLSESDVKNNMDDFINNNSIQYTEKFTVDYLNGKTFYIPSQWADNTEDEYSIIKMVFTSTTVVMTGYDDDPDDLTPLSYVITEDGTLEFEKLGVLIDIAITSISNNNLVVDKFGSYSKPATMYLDETEANNALLNETKEFTVDYLNGRTLYQDYIDYDEPIHTYTLSLDTQTSFLDENIDPAVTRDDAYEAMDGMIRIIDGKIYEYTTNDNGQYNDGINIYTITSVDTDKIICSVEIPEGSTTVYFYFNNPN